MNQVTPVTPAIDFKVNITTGEAYISIRKTAELLGIDEKTIRNFLDLSAPNYDRKQGLTPEILQKVTQHYSLKGNLAAIDLLSQIPTFLLSKLKSLILPCVSQVSCYPVSAMLKAMK